MVGSGVAGGRQYYVLSLHRDTPLDQQALPSGEPAQPEDVGGPRASSDFDDGFLGFTLKGAALCTLSCFPTHQTSSMQSCIHASPIMHQLLMHQLSDLVMVGPTALMNE